ncbi:transposase [Streptomyces microflavus]
MQDPIAGLIIDLVAGRGELTDAAWERIEPLLPRVDGRGRPRRDHRQVEQNTAAGDLANVNNTPHYRQYLRSTPPDAMGLSIQITSQPG